MVTYAGKRNGVIVLSVATKAIRLDLSGAGIADHHHTDAYLPAKARGLRVIIVKI